MIISLKWKSDPPDMLFQASFSICFIARPPHSIPEKIDNTVIYRMYQFSIIRNVNLKNSGGGGRCSM